MGFKELGLTTNEAKAYEATLQLGKASAAQISQHCGVPYGRIYPVLGALEQKHLVKVVPERTKQYVPSDPEHLREYINIKKKALEDAEKKALTYKSLYDSRDEEPVQVTKGRAIHTLFRNLPKAKHYKYSIKYGFDLHPEFIREVNVCHKNNVDYKVIGRIDHTTARNVKVWEKTHKPIKNIENEGIALSLIDDEFILITMIQSNTNLLIKDKPFIKLMRQLYLAYYNKDT